jgi:hypothetical protein
MMTDDQFREKMQQTMALRDLVRGLLSGKVSRVESVDIIDELCLRWKSFGWHQTVISSLKNNDVCLGTAYVVRNSDWEHYFRWLVEGDALPAMVPCTSLHGSCQEWAQRLGQTTVRYWVEGWGWCETIQFVSPVTGRCFAGTSVLLEGVVEHEPGCLEVVYLPRPGDSEDRALVLGDLFDTLPIENSDVFPEPSVTRGSWEVWRQDDNGNRNLISVHTGRAKAFQVLAKFEQLSHKQMYWIEEKSNVIIKLRLPVDTMGCF